MANNVPFYKVPKILMSSESECGAVRLITKIRNGFLGMDVLPNSYPQYTGVLEEEDFLCYSRFLESANGKKLLTMLEVQDAGNSIVR